MEGTYTAFNRKEKRHFFFLSVWRQKMMMKIVSKKNVSIFLCLSSVLNMMYARVFLSSVHHIILYPPFNVSMISDCVCVCLCVSKQLVFVHYMLPFPLDCVGVRMWPPFLCIISRPLVALNSTRGTAQSSSSSYIWDDDVRIECNSSIIPATGIASV